MLKNIKISKNLKFFYFFLGSTAFLRYLGYCMEIFLDASKY